MASAEDLLSPSDIDPDNLETAEAAIQLASEYLNREDFEVLPVAVKLGVKQLASDLASGSFGQRSVETEKIGSASVTYQKVEAGHSLTDASRSYLSPYRCLPGL